jgi:hypothetical protein
VPVCAQTAGTPSPTADLPAANPSRPTVTNPATLPPTGYLQFEQGYLGALASPGTQSVYGYNEVAKIAVDPRLLLQVQTQPYAFSNAPGTPTHNAGDIVLGPQIVLYAPATAKKTPVPTVAIGYLGRVYSGNTAGNDEGGFANSLILLFSGDFGSWHYDTNYLVNEQTNTNQTLTYGAGANGQSTLTTHTYKQRRAQFAETLSVNHAIFNDKLQLSVELTSFTQPFVNADRDGRLVAHANAVDVLIAPSYAVRPNLVLDAGFAKGLNSTATTWQSFAGFTYLLPHRLFKPRR